MRLKIVIIFLLVTPILALGYPDFEVLVNDNPFQEKMVFSLRDQINGNTFMTIIEPDLNNKFYIVSQSAGWDFKVNKNYLTFFQKSPPGWYVVNRNMVQVDFLQSVNGYSADNHDIQYLDNGGYILQSYVLQPIDLPQTSHIDIVRTLVLQEFDHDHNLIMEWNNSDHMSILDYIDYLNLEAASVPWTHGNSIEIDYDENIIISNRAMNEVVKFDRISGDIIWILGGPNNFFSFVGDPYNGPLMQHDARRLENGNIMIFDNGSTLGENSRPSRVTEYIIDEINLSATLIWEYFHPEEFVAVNQGSAQKLENENILINWGTVTGNGAIITEVTPDKEVVLDLRFPENINTYKVRKKNWSFNQGIMKADINNDSKINIIDVIIAVGVVLDGPSDYFFDIYKLDLNQDGKVNISDLLAIVNIIVM